MCGISGIFHFNNSKYLDRIHLMKKQMIGMLNLIAHRGPDDHGIELINENLILGHRRLSIIDTSSVGKQPMVDESTKNWITFNGEIYNYVEIRQELESLGHIFKTHTDTEVILKAYAQWGVKCFSKFVGMWALAIWDEKDQKLLLSRDRNGMKPLYYYKDKDVFIFASEFKAIIYAMKLLGIDAILSTSKLQGFVAIGYYAHNRNHFQEHPFENLNDFPHNQIMAIDRTSKERYFDYWDVFDSVGKIKPMLEKMTIENRCEMLKNKLETSIKRHLRSDVPIGLSLSGGLDSSSISAIAKGLHNSQLNTYSIDYNKYDCGEGHFAKEVNEMHGFNGHLIDVNGKNFLDDLSEIIWMRDIPTNAYGLASMWNVMKRASKDVKVILSGQGADEILAGYHYYYQSYVIGEYQKNNNIDNLSQMLDQIKDKTEASIFSTLKNLAFDFNYHKKQKASYQNDFDELLDRHLYEDMDNNSLPRLLMNEDRCSMAFSLESRLPFLDHELIEFILALKVSDKINDGWTKYILRKTMDKMLPNNVCWRREKKGYATPFNHWLIENQGFKDILSNTKDLKINKYMDSQAISNLLSKIDVAKANNSVLNGNDVNQIWYCINLEIWLNEYETNIKNTNNDFVI